VMVMVEVVICKGKVVEEMAMEGVVTCKHMEEVVRHKCKAHWPPQ